MVLAVGLAGCGGGGAAPDDGQAPTTAGGEATTTSRPAEAELTHADFPSGASIDHPADWISYGVGASSGSLELAIPQTADVSLRDAAASEYLYGPLFPEAGSLQAAMAILAASLGLSEVPGATLTTVGGREILHATAQINGADALFAVTESEGAYASVFAPSLAGPLSSDTIAAVLAVFASITP